MVITETELRARYARGGVRRLTVSPSDIITTAARDYIREQKIELVEGKQQAPPPPTLSAPGQKPEHMTHLNGRQLVEKSHPRIRFRGAIDGVQAKILETQCTAHTAGEPDTVEALGELLAHARALLAAEVKEEPLPEAMLLGMTQAELREASHHPETHFGVPHFYPDYRMGPVVVALNALRTLVRQCELSCVEAFPSGERTDLIQALNRMSSAVYIIECRLVAKQTERGTPPWMKSW